MTTTSASIQPATQPSTLAGSLPAAAAGAAAIGLAIYQVAAPGTPVPTYTTISDWVREGLFACYLVTAIVAAVAALRARLAPSLAGLVPLGYALILVGVTAGMALREDPEWFVVLGGPGVLLSTVGFVVWGVLGLRRGILPGSAALQAAVGGPAAILGAELGLSVLVGAFWLWVAVRLRG